MAQRLFRVVNFSRMEISFPAAVKHIISCTWPAIIFYKSNIHLFPRTCIRSFEINVWGPIVSLKGSIVHQFWIYKIFFVSQQKKHFLWKVHLDETTLTRNNWENRVLKVSPTEYCYIYNIYNTDWLWAPFYSIISSQSCFIEMDLS